MLTQGSVVSGEGGEKVAVNIKLTDDLLFDKDGDNDFGLGFERTGQVARVGGDVVDDDSLAGGSSGTADALVQRNASTQILNSVANATDRVVLTGRWPRTSELLL